VGRWNTDVMVTSYVNHLPWLGIKMLAGFSDNPGELKLERSAVSPPSNLKKKLFPELEEFIEYFESNLYLFLFFS
jgi:hypothetical protein